MEFIQQPYFLVLLFILGIMAQMIPSIPKDIYRKINKFIIYIPLPAIVLTKIPHLVITEEVLFPIASAWIIFFGSAIYAYFICKWMNFDRKTMACIILCCGLGNTSFVGYPILTYFYGEQSIQYAIFVDQPGSFLILSTLGILVAAYFSSGDVRLSQITKRLFMFPPFLVFIIALFLPSQAITGNIFNLLDYTGKCMVPLAILSLGLQFKWNLKEIEWNKFFAAISYKLILAPLIIFILFYFLLKKEGQLYSVSVIECAMPPMITSSILATEYGLDEKLANSLPTLGILLSVPTLLFWKWLLGHY